MFFLPELPWVLAWMLLGAPNVGLLNQWLRAIVPGVDSVINVYSYARARRSRRGPVGDGAVPLRPSGVPRDGRDAGGGGTDGGGGPVAHDRADQLPAADARAPRLRHPLVRGGHGVVRDAAAARHPGEDLRVHDQDLRSGLRRPRRELRRGHRAGGAAAPPDAEPHRRAVEDPEGPVVHDRLRPRLPGAARSTSARGASSRSRSSSASSSCSGRSPSSSCS